MFVGHTPPEQVSARSQMPADGRHVVPSLLRVHVAGCCVVDGTHAPALHAYVVTLCVPEPVLTQRSAYEQFVGGAVSVG